MATKPFEKAVTTLEYDKILTMLSALCSVEAGKEKIMTLRPEGDFARVVRLQKETAAAKRICALKGAPSLSAHPSVPAILERAEKGAVLNPTELLRVGSLLRSVDAAHRYGEGTFAGTGSGARDPSLYFIGRYFGGRCFSRASFHPSENDCLLLTDPRILAALYFRCLRNLFAGKYHYLPKFPLRHSRKE